MPIGTYSVSITLTGFQTAITNNVEVDVATERRVDAQLKTGQVTQTVEVSGGDLPQIETQSNDLGGVLTSKAVEDLPINGRDYTKLIFLNPGVAGSPDQITDSPGSFGEFSMNGARGRSNNYLLDGTDMNDGYRNDPAINQGGVFAVPSAILPIGAVAEMKVLSNFQPEYGRNAGAVVNIVTKSGTNALHGELFEYFRNNALDARNYFDQSQSPRRHSTTTSLAARSAVQSSKTKLSSSSNYEGQRETVGSVTVACVPDAAQISAAQTAILAGGGTISSIECRLWSMSTRTIPRTIFPESPPTKLAASDANNDFAPDYIASAPSFNNLSSFIAKIDHNFNGKNNVTGRYFFGDSTQSFPLALTASGGQLPALTPSRRPASSWSPSPWSACSRRKKVNEAALRLEPVRRRLFRPGSEASIRVRIGLCAASSPADCSGAGPHDSGLPIILVSVTPSGASSFFAQPGATSGDPRQRVDTNNSVHREFLLEDRQTRPQDRF